MDIRTAGIGFEDSEGNAWFIGRCDRCGNKEAKIVQHGIVTGNVSHISICDQCAHASTRAFLEGKYGKDS